jgi:riboflavin biosynthesis pyrimidine reductase
VEGEQVLTLNHLHPRNPRAGVDATVAFAYPLQGRHLRANMVTSVDGAAVLEGRVGSLSGPVDHQLLLLLRSLCDVLLVGAGTVRAEGYGPVRAQSALVGVRRALGQLPHPRLAVLTRRLDLDLGSAAFSKAPERPIVITTELAGQERVRSAEKVAEVLVAGETSVDLGAALDLLEQRGLRRMLSEGGPHALGDLYAADLVDELCWAISPLVVAGQEPRLTAGPPMPEPLGVRLETVMESDGFLFLRYLRP